MSPTCPHGSNNSIAYILVMVKYWSLIISLKCMDKLGINVQHFLGNVSVVHGCYHFFLPQWYYGLKTQENLRGSEDKIFLRMKKICWASLSPLSKPCHFLTVRPGSFSDTLVDWFLYGTCDFARVSFCWQIHWGNYCITFVLCIPLQSPEYWLCILLGLLYTQWWRLRGGTWTEGRLKTNKYKS